MRRAIKRELLLLGIVLLTAVCLSLYDKYGNSFRDVQTIAEKETEESDMEELKRRVLIENENAAMSEKDAGKKDTPETVGSIPAKANPDIRVLICSDNYEGEFHDSLSVRATVPFTFTCGDVTQAYGKEDTLFLEPGSPLLKDGRGVLELEGEGSFLLPDLKRNQPCPSYEGTLAVEEREEGLLLVNTLPLETYLCYVVPSEMPSDYPGEALKAQAVCARCYAYLQLEGDRCAEFGADLDDSVSYQVYNNVGVTQEAVNAVCETADLVMTEDGRLEDALYYSTSCGIRIEDDLSEEAVFCTFLSGGSDAYEENEPWYRWHTVFSTEYLQTLVERAYPARVGTVSRISVAQREPNGRASVLSVSGDLGAVQIEGEYQIRKFLQTSGTEVILQDGSTAPDLGMLPSAFFYITPLYEGEELTGFLLNGGGYGHGNGMSQNGAKHMALEGKSCEEILKYYYGDGVEMLCVQ